ncbi:MAG: carboxypeptidase-like regulatory domain-containing protein [candidate division Zixibacteria bacterium]|nr:carboxypeptidase-like regulatory domain-containing protein [candidate division Zixibacteria bacterium]
MNTIWGRILTGICGVILIAGSALGAHRTITGRTLDKNDLPLVGATVLLYHHDRYVTGAATDISGAFSFAIDDSLLTALELRISSVGYTSLTYTIKSDSDTSAIILYLDENAIQLNRITVRPIREANLAQLKLSSATISRQSRHSLVSTNPVAAIKQPQVMREGSSHSSKLRVYGTSPTYYLNGTAIGYDPNHYGMFSIIPGTALNSLTVYPLGTDASFALPAAVTMDSPTTFSSRLQGAMNLSTTDATATMGLGGGRYFLTASLRKSVLDKLVDELNVDGDRTSIPPTNFQDVFVSTGLRLSSNTCLLVDHYQVRDYLSYQLDPTDLNPEGIDTYQHTNEKYYGAKLQTIGRHTSFKLQMSARSSYEIYRAYPPENYNKGDYHVYLNSERRTYQASAETGLNVDSWEITIGDQGQYIADREIVMDQYGWNFLPPDAASDNPFLYQYELNELYQNYVSNDNEFNNAAYATVCYHFAHGKISSGIRHEYFGTLGKKREWVSRHTLTLYPAEHHQVELFYGTFAENPANKIIQPYQVPIHDNLENLRPVLTRLLAVKYTYGPARIDVFRKTISRLPVLTPDFSEVAKDGSVGESFITMQSTGAIEFYGANIALAMDRLPYVHGNLQMYYGYSHADKIVGNVTMPYELNAEHRFYLSYGRRLVGCVSFGTEFAARSGYYYTPVWTADYDKGLNRYSQEYYESHLQTENSERFPVNYTLDMHFDFDFGKVALYLGVSNVTNHDNPIINSSDGYVYDAGILPNIGLTYSF